MYRLGRPEQVFFGGEVQPTIKYRDEIGQPLLHSYEIYNAGPWKVPYLSVVVSWPYQVENGKPIGKWLLYMDETPKVDGTTHNPQVQIQVSTQFTYCLIFR